MQKKCSQEETPVHAVTVSASKVREAQTRLDHAKEKKLDLGVYLTILKETREEERQANDALESQTKASMWSSPHF
jgi:hypothetical protein